MYSGFGAPLSSSSSSAAAAAVPGEYTYWQRNKLTGVIQSENYRVYSAKVTINTNTKPRTQATAIMQMGNLQRAIYDVLGTPKLIRPFVWFRNDPSRGGDSARWYHLIDSVWLDVGIELGPKTGFVHGHFTIRITHRVGGDGIFLRKYAIQQALDAHLRRVYGMQLPRLYLKGGTPDDVWREYIRKDQSERSAFRRVLPGEERKEGPED